MNTSNSNVIHTQGLTKAYQGAKALDSLNLQFPKNSIFGFLGLNGAGKSTTIKMLLGLTHPYGQLLGLRENYLYYLLLGDAV